MELDFSRLSRWEVMGAAGAALGVLALFFLPWYSISDEAAATKTDDDWICGVGETSCTGWETFPILRWILIAAGTAPIILAWIVVRGHKLTWPPGEMTMTVGFTGLILIAYNGILDKPGQMREEIGVGLDYGYLVALLVGLLISAGGYFRAQAGTKKERKAPGTV
jgi:hypothetical protein